VIPAAPRLLRNPRDQLFLTSWPTINHHDRQKLVNHYDDHRQFPSPGIMFSTIHAEQPDPAARYPASRVRELLAFEGPAREHAHAAMSVV